MDEGERSRTKPANGKHEFSKRLHRRFDEEGITIPFPIRTLDVPDTFRVQDVEGGTGERPVG